MVFSGSLKGNVSDRYRQLFRQAFPFFMVFVVEAICTPLFSVFYGNTENPMDSPIHAIIRSHGTRYFVEF